MRGKCPVCKREFDSDDILGHLENAHHQPVARPDESEDQMLARFLNDNPGARECFLCYQSGAPWTPQVKQSKRFSRQSGPAETMEN